MTLLVEIGKTYRDSVENLRENTHGHSPDNGPVLQNFDETLSEFCSTYILTLLPTILPTRGNISSNLQYEMKAFYCIFHYSQ